MKKAYYLLFFCFCSFLSFAQKKTIPHQFILDGRIRGKTNGEVFICYTDAKGRFLVDSARLENEEFQLKGLINSATIAFLTTVKRSLPEEDDEVMKTDGKNSTLFFLEPKNIQADLQDSHFGNGKFTGSFTQTEYADYTRQLNLLTETYQAKNDSLKLISPMHDHRQEAARKNQDSLNNIAVSSLTNDFLTRHPNSYVSAYLVSCSHYKLDFMELIYHRLPPEVKLSVYGREIKEKMEKKQRVVKGRQAPQFKQVSRTGDTIALRDFRGKYLLLQFWSSVNSVSRAENRALIPVYNRFKDKNFTVLGISLDGRKTRTVWEETIEKDQLPWMQLAALKSNHNQAVLEYDVDSLPANFLIGPDGRILGTDLGTEKLNQVLAKILP